LDSINLKIYANLLEIKIGAGSARISLQFVNT
jgi:hypothetical protein